MTSTLRTWTKMSLYPNLKHAMPNVDWREFQAAFNSFLWCDCCLWKSSLCSSFLFDRKKNFLPSFSHGKKGKIKNEMKLKKGIWKRKRKLKNMKRRRTRKEDEQEKGKKMKGKKMKKENDDNYGPRRNGVNNSWGLKLLGLLLAPMPNFIQKTRKLKIFTFGRFWWVG